MLPDVLVNPPGKRAKIGVRSANDDTTMLGATAVQLLEINPVVGEDGARMFCAEEQLLLVALPQHVGIFGSSTSKPRPERTFAKITETSSSR